MRVTKKCLLSVLCIHPSVRYVHWCIGGGGWGGGERRGKVLDHMCVCVTTFGSGHTHTHTALLLSLEAVGV